MLVRFNSAYKPDEVIHINAAHVLAVKTNYEGRTLIVTDGSDRDGSISYGVQEDVDTVVDRINVALGGN